MLTFNINDGYLEALVKGFKNNLLKKEDYQHLTQCDNLEDLKVHLQSNSGLSAVLANEPSPIDVMTIEDRLREKLVSEFAYLRANAVAPLSEFLDFITYSYMIDNVVLLISGTLNERPLSELVPKCNPLGIFDQMEAVTIANTPTELYNAILIDTPLGEFFMDSITMDEIPEMDPEIIRNVLYRTYLEKFHKFVSQIGGQTGEVMQDIIEFEADRRSFIITLNSFGTGLDREDKKKLYPKCGKLGQAGLEILARAEGEENIRMAADSQSCYASLFDSSSDGFNQNNTTLEDRLYQLEAQKMMLSFLVPFNYGVFYAWLKLKEQEIRNVIWIAECIAQGQRGKIDSYIAVL